MPRLSSLPPRLAAAPLAVGYATPQDAERARDRARVQGNNLRRLYRTKRWRETRLEVLERDGWTCRQTGVFLTGRYPAADSPVIDHIKKPEGNLALFWDLANLQAVSKAWHDSEKQRQERAAAILAPR
ncbi:HNH endonuclease [Sulfitobacter sp. M21595]|uniref:HNH endonuclease n=1 Tax=Sulfitobacter sp. M21595 TaxID=3368574 RepID=UPI003744D481